jgi:RNA polymerase sigma-70 factor (ECF subfamily)
MSLKLDPASADDAALVNAAQAGAVEAFEELVHRYRDKIYARAFSILRNEDNALEVSQEAWIRIWQRLAQFHGDSSFATWATRVTINIALDFLRKQKRVPQESIEEIAENTGDADWRLPPIPADPTAGLEREELRRKIDEALGQLSVEHRTALILCEFEEMEYKEIAKQMQCSIGTVMSRLFYARRKLAAALAGVNLEDYR